MRGQKERSGVGMKRDGERRRRKGERKGRGGDTQGRWRGGHERKGGRDGGAQRWMPGRGNKEEEERERKEGEKNSIGEKVEKWKHTTTQMLFRFQTTIIALNVVLVFLYPRRS